MSTEIQENPQPSTEVQKPLDNALQEFVTDVAPPTPGVGDMSAVTPQPVGAVGVAAPISPEKKDARGRKKLPRDANGKIIREQKPQIPPQPDRPKLNGLPPGMGQTVDHNTAAIDPAAEVAVMLVNASGMMLGGVDAAMKPEESIMAKQGFVSYFRAKGVNNVPAWVVLAGALTPYYLRVITVTPAKSKIAVFFSNAGAYIKGFFRGKNARLNSGNDRERENNSSQKNSAESKA